MSEVMRASRTVENEIIIAPAHVTASAVLHAYQLLATSGQEQVYALVVKNDIDKVDKLAGKRIYLPQQDSLRSYVAKGLLTESGVKLSQFAKVTYGTTSGGGLVALSFDMADVTVADESRPRTGSPRILDRAHPEDDPRRAGRHEHGGAQGLLRHRVRPPATGSIRPTARSRASDAFASRRPMPAASSPTSPRSASRLPTRSPA